MGSFNLQGDWPLVGRAEELAELVRIVEAGMAAPEAPAGAVVVAPAGVGKTRLLREVRRSAEQLGVPTVMAIAARSATCCRWPRAR
ncbi:ATP-binding protein [Segeticoccus rhizosphaerae]|uniref:ATP-binding protein n=1 Tax=Segeticoccus rhizosphaerae TaxID=1104777 RepID=UPI001396C615|nr:ATP-binding protein [Segeticoccus rhizosphaerae]